MEKWGRARQLLVGGMLLGSGWVLISSAPMTKVVRFSGSPEHVTVTRVPDLTAGALPVVQVVGQDPVAKTSLYEIRVRNVTEGPLAAKSMVVVLDRITDNRTGEEVGMRFETLGADGMTVDGKPFFRVPTRDGNWIAAAHESAPIRVKIRDQDRVSFFVPSFRVRGVQPA